MSQPTHGDELPSLLKSPASSHHGATASEVHTGPMTDFEFRFTASMDISAPTSADIAEPLEASLPFLDALSLSAGPNLGSLPTEIHLAIIQYLTIPTNQFLRSTNCYFRTLIPPLTHDSLLEAEKSDLACKNDAYACAVCLRLRRSGSFADALRKNAYGRDRKDGKQEKRFCIDCGVKGKDSTLKYKWGDTWTRFGLPYVKCRGCLGKKRGVRERKDCPMCPSCWEKKNGRK